LAATPSGAAAAPSPARRGARARRLRDEHRSCEVSLGCCVVTVRGVRRGSSRTGMSPRSGWSVLAAAVDRWGFRPQRTAGSAVDRDDDAAVPAPVGGPATDYHRAARRRPVWLFGRARRHGRAGGRPFTHAGPRARARGRSCRRSRRSPRDSAHSACIDRPNRASRRHAHRRPARPNRGDHPRCRVPAPSQRAANECLPAAQHPRQVLAGRPERGLSKQAWIDGSTVLALRGRGGTRGWAATIGAASEVAAHGARVATQRSQMVTLCDRNGKSGKRLNLRESSTAGRERPGSDPRQRGAAHGGLHPAGGSGP
jgi:hypothetical protein